MIIKRASTMGFCFGVKNVLKLADEILSSASGPYYSLGEIVHNRAIVDEYTRRGLKVIDLDSKVEKGTLLIRAHGVSPSVEKHFADLGFDIVDGTCPLVKKNQLACCRSDLPVIIFCKRGHDEAVGIAGYARNRYYGVETEEELERIPVGDYTVIVQTTFSSSKLERFTDILRKKGCNLTFSGSGICSASVKRRNAVVELAKGIEAIIVIGDRESSNSRTLYDLASSLVEHAFFISSPDMITEEMVRFRSIGITAGASVSDDIVDAVEKRLQDLSLDDK